MQPFKEDPSEPNLERSGSEPDLDIDKYCLICPASTKSPSSHHASFGDNGTTATVSRYGDIMQVTKRLETGSSGIFSMDHRSTHEPYFISDRARDLEELSQSFYGNTTYGLSMWDWPTTDPTVVKWVNWRWPRYEWETTNLKTVFQYYVHDGIVLHQLFFQNIGGIDSVETDLVDCIYLGGKMRVQDVDYLSCNRQDEEKEGEDGSAELEHTGPRGYGRVQINWKCQVAAVIDIFVDGCRTKISKGEGKDLKPLGPGDTREIVVAHKLSLLPQHPTWQDFMIPAAKADVQKLLGDEIKSQGSRYLASTILPLVSWTKLDIPQTDATRQGKKSEPRELEKMLGGQRTQYTSRKDATHHGEKSDPRGLAEVDTQLRMIQYLAARHLEHILSVCAVPSPFSDNRPPGHTPVALTCGDMSGHRICTSAS